MGFKAKDPRRHRRYHYLDELKPGRLVNNSDKEIVVRIRDVSRMGLGIQVADEFKPGTRLYLDFPERRVYMEVRYCTPVLHSNEFHVGLMAIDPQTDLHVFYPLPADYNSKPE